MQALYLFILLVLVSCAPTPQKDAPLHLKPATFEQLPGWKQDNFTTVIPAFTRSCERILKRSPQDRFGPLPEAATYGDWQPVCRKFLSLNNPAPRQLHLFFEQNFRPYAVFAGREAKGLFTGYYEASLRGSRTKYGPYRYPLHARPDDLVMVHLGEFREHLKGERIAGRVKNGTLKPYEDRASIVQGNWPHNDQVLVWVDDPVDAFFVQIQGSGIVQLPGGDTMRIGYAGQNGHPYYAIGRELIKRGYLTKETVSMQSIRLWLEANPNEADEIMNTNRSYVFFTELEGDGPLGAEGIALTPGRSLAVDRTKLVYGAPMWVYTKPPVPQEHAPLRKLMIAQDTGGAIRGAVRGDVFWGYGDTAEYLAGHMKSDGRYWILLPKHLMQ